MRRATLAAGAALTLALLPAATTASDETDPEIATGLDEVRAATAAYHWLPHALEAGFAPFSLEGTDIPTCFESDSGGMGVHYVRGVDDVVEASDPEALVYEVTADGGMRLVAVEYVVPEEFVEDESGAVVALPEVHGQPFHKHATLPLYILHAWVWEDNPDGMFADYNPMVAACPEA